MASKGLRKALTLCSFCTVQYGSENVVGNSLVVVSLKKTGTGVLELAQALLRQKESACKGRKPADSAFMHFM